MTTNSIVTSDDDGNLDMEQLDPNDLPDYCVDCDDNHPQDEHTGRDS